ncbi:hypothetical protein FF1_015099 [Malus domestica]
MHYIVYCFHGRNDINNLAGQVQELGRYFRTERLLLYFQCPINGGHDQVQLRLPIPLPHLDPWPDEYDVETIPDPCRVEKRGCGGAQRTLPAGLLLEEIFQYERYTE